MFHPSPPGSIQASFSEVQWLRSRMQAPLRAWIRGSGKVASAMTGRVGRCEGLRGPQAGAPAFAQASENNKEPILKVLKHHLIGPNFSERATPDRPLLTLEISSGTGQHVGHFFENFASICPCIWQPSDVESSLFSSIEYYVLKAEERIAQRSSGGGGHRHFSCVLEPLLIDVRSPGWVVNCDNRHYWDAAPEIVAISGGESRSDTLKTGLNLNGDGKFDAVFNANMIHITPYECCEGLFNGVAKVLRPSGKFFLYGPFNINGEYTSDGNRIFDRNLKMSNPEWGIRDMKAVQALGEKGNLRVVEVHRMPANNCCIVFEKVA